MRMAFMRRKASKPARKVGIPQKLSLILARTFSSRCRGPKAFAAARRGIPPQRLFYGLAKVLHRATRARAELRPRQERPFLSCLER